MEEQKKTLKISLKTAVLVSLLFILLLIFLISLFNYLLEKNNTIKNTTNSEEYDVIKVNLIDKNERFQYKWKNDIANMIIEKVYIKDNNNVQKLHNIVFFSTEFFENFLKDSFYDQKNQKFYFYGKESGEYVKGNDDTYYNGKSKSNLVNGLNISTKVIDGKLYIPIPLDNNHINFSLGYDKETNNVYYYGPQKSNLTTQDLSNIKIINEINKTTLYYDSDKFLNDERYSTLEYMIDLKDGVHKYFSAEIDKKSYIIKVYYKYDGYNYIYDKYEIVTEGINGNIIKKIDENGKFHVVKNNQKYGIIDVNNNIILETIYDDIEGYENTEKYCYIDDKIEYHTYGNNTYEFNLNGIIVKLKKDNKYTLYSLDKNINILNNEWYDNINTKTEIKYFDTYSKKEKEKNIKTTCIYSNDGIGMVLDYNLYLKPIYSKIELVSSEKEIYKLYKNNKEFFILFLKDIYDNYNTNNNFENLGDRYYISKKSYKDIEIKTKYSGDCITYHIYDNETGDEIAKGILGYAIH